MFLAINAEIRRQASADAHEKENVTIPIHSYLPFL